MTFLTGLLPFALILCVIAIATPKQSRTAGSILMAGFVLISTSIAFGMSGGLNSNDGLANVTFFVVITNLAWTSSIRSAQAERSKIWLLSNWLGAVLWASIVGAAIGWRYSAYKEHLDYWIVTSRPEDSVPSSTTYLVWVCAPAIVLTLAFSWRVRRRSA